MYWYGDTDVGGDKVPKKKRMGIRLEIFIEHVSFPGCGGPNRYEKILTARRQQLTGLSRLVLIYTCGDRRQHMTVSFM